MSIFWALLRRELSAYFFSLTGYVIIAAITFLTGESFVQLIDALGGDPWPMPVTQMFFGSFYFWMIVLLAAPVITMRLFALEKASGTFETLMTTPGRRFAGGGGKVHGGVFVLYRDVAAVAGLPADRRSFHQPGQALDYGTVGGMFLGIFLAGGFFLSFGCLASSLTRSQMVAAMVSLAFGVSQFALAWWAKNNPVSEQWQSQLLSCLNLFDQMNDFARGAVDTRAVIFYVSATFLFLFLTLRVVESRRWK